MSRHLHIVAFDLPYPPNYGGSTDMFFKLRAFAKLNIKVTLHVFLYGGKNPPGSCAMKCTRCTIIPEKDPIHLPVNCLLLFQAEAQINY